jgi:hypothetical protein
MSENRENFSTEIDAALIQRARDAAANQGRDLPSIIEEALARYLTGPVDAKASRARRSVQRAFEESADRYAALYERLAK